MNGYKYDYMKEADANIVIDAYCSGHDDSIDLEIVNFSFAPVTYLLKEILNEGRPLNEISLTVHHYCDSEQSDFAERLSDFSEALKNLQLSKFSLTQKSLKINDAVVDCICKGLARSEQLSKLELHGLVSDKGAEMIANFVKKMPCMTYLFLQENAIGDKGAAQIIEAAHYNSRYLSTVDFSLNNLTDRSISAIIAAPRSCYVRAQANQITSSGQQQLQKRGQHTHFLNRYNEEYQLFKQPRIAKNTMSGRQKYLAEILLSAPERQYKEAQSGELEFSESPTQQLSLQQLLIADPKLWEIPCENEHEDKSTPKIYKEIVICAFSATLHNFIFSSRFVPGILYWQGDPHHFGAVFDDKFTPAKAADVEELLERVRPAEAHRYWVIDEKRWRETLVAADSSSLNDFDFFYAKKEVDLSPFAFYMTDDLFRKIAQGISNITTQIELASCRHLSPATLCQVFRQFPRLQFLGLRQGKPWGVELKTLTQTCPYLEELEICIDTAAPLEMLSQFRYLRRLYLDLSGNLQLRNLNFLKDCGDRVTLLKLSGCTNLTDLTGLKYCPNLQEIWFEKMILVDFKSLIQQLGQLKGLTLLALHECQYSADSQLLKLIYQCLPRTHISTSGTVVNTITPGARIGDNFLSSPCETDIPDSNASSREMTCGFSYLDPSERQHTVSQIFWDSKGHWPDHRLDRWSTLDQLKINDDGHIVFSASFVDQLDLKICPDVLLIPFEKIDVPLLRDCELKSPVSEIPCDYYAGQLTVMVIADQWTHIPSREVFSRPIASSQPLIWARSAVTGELFVRLQTRQHRTQKILLRYAFAATKVTSHLQTRRHQNLPILIQDAFTALSKNEKILANFPKFRRFITDMQSTGNDQTRYARIKRYCQMDSVSGFTDAPLDNKISTDVLEFIGTLRLKDVNTRTDLYSFFNTLLQQKGVCADITRCAKLLCGYYGGIPCHIGISKTHAFLNWSYQEKDKFITSTTDLGGGEAQVTLQPLAPLTAEIKTSISPAEEYTLDLESKHQSRAEECIANLESKNQKETEKYTADLEAKYQSELEKHKAQVIAQALVEFKSVILDGEDSRNLTEYWRLVLSCPNPLIYFPKSADTQKALAALRLYALEQLGFAPRQLFYINDPEQLSTWWETVHISGHQLEIVPGWLRQFLLEKTPRILVLNLDKFKPYDLASNQGIGDKQRTLQNLILPLHIKVICFAPQELAREDIFLSRFTEVACREDLFSAAEPIPYLWPMPAEEKTRVSDVMHLYDDSRHTSNCLGVPVLEGDRPTFSPGPLARAMTEKHNLLLTDVPEKLHSLLFLAAFCRQTMVNGISQEFPDIKIYA